MQQGVEIMHMLMQSASLIVTPLRTSTCKTMNWLEVSRIAGCHTNLCKHFLGGPPAPLFNTTPPDEVLLTQCKSFYCFYNKKEVLYLDTTIHMYILPYITLTPLWIFFVLFTFWENIVPPTYRHGATPLTYFPFLSSNLQSSPAYGVLISQLIWYLRACSSYKCVIFDFHLSLSGRDMSGNVRDCHSGSYMVDRGISFKSIKSPSPKCHMTFCDMFIHSDTLRWSDISPNRDLITELDLIDLITLFREASIRHLQRVRLPNRGRLLLRTLGPVQFGTWICS